MDWSNNSSCQSISKSRSNKTKLQKKETRSNFVLHDSSANSYKCKCSCCKEVCSEMASLAKKKCSIVGTYSSIIIGDRVVLRGRYSGTVRYIGDLDSAFVNSKIFVGVKLDDPVGIHDGIHKGKRYFKCPPSHGVFVPLSQVKVIPVPGRKAPVLTKPGTKQKQKLIPRPMTALYQANPSQNTSTVPLIGSKKSQSNSSSISNSDECKNNQCLPTLKLSVSSLLNHSPSIPVSSSDKSYCKNSAPNTSEEESSAASLIKVAATQATPPDETGFPSKNQKSFLSHQQNEMDTFQWQKNIESIKTDPDTARIYLNSKPNVYRDVQIDVDLMEEDKSSQLLETSFRIDPKASYTSRLLSGLPNNESVTPSSDSKLKDLEEFSHWFKEWGGDVRGWMMANTMQKLKDAHRKGEKEIQWQIKIDELECDKEFNLQVQRIKDLHQQISEVRKMRNSFEAQIRSTAFACSKAAILRNSVLKYQKKLELEEKRCAELEAAVQGHKMAFTVNNPNYC